jgi:hypothetical protein
VAEIDVDADELVAVNPGEVAFGDGGSDVGEAGEAGFARGEGLFVQVKDALIASRIPLPPMDISTL